MARTVVELAGPTVDPLVREEVVEIPADSRGEFLMCRILAPGQVAAQGAAFGVAFGRSEQQVPAGIGQPCGQTVGWPSSVQIESVTAGEQQKSSSEKTS